MPGADCPEHGVAAEMPQAAQAVDRFHVTRLFSRATDGVRRWERRESEEERAMLAGTNYVWLKREPDLTERQLAKMRGLDPARSHWWASTP
jgi:transposase